MIQYILLLIIIIVFFTAIRISGLHRYLTLEKLQEQKDILQNYVDTMGAETVFISQYFSGDTANPNEVSCFGLNDGEVAVNVWGGHGPYTYAWIGNSFSANTATITNLYAGVYSVTIKDTNDCMVNTSVELKQPDQLEFTTSLDTSLEESCLGACDGEIVVDFKKNIENRPIVSGNFLNQPAIKLYNLSTKNKFYNISSHQIFIQSGDVVRCHLN